MVEPSKCDYKSNVTKPSWYNNNKKKKKKKNSERIFNKMNDVVGLLVNTKKHPFNC